MANDKLPEEDEQASGPASSTATPSPSRKRLLLAVGPKPNSSASSDSAFSDSSVRFRKKTRDLPNLSDCHSCGFHTTNNGNDRLQTLDSHWRIVLLCKKCLNRVKSSELCSYCFTESSEDSFRCRQCERRVHGDCVLKYRGFAPWSYSCSGSGGFSVCVDCWVPKSLEKSGRVCRSRSLSGNSTNIPSLGNSRVSSAGGRSKLLEAVVKDAKCAAEKKVKAANRAREKALRTAVVARKAVELASNALDLVSKRDENSAKECLVTGTKVVDDAQLAFQLHRAMNSSKRISKSLCSVNSSCLVVPKMWDCNGDSSVRVSDCGSPSVCGKLEVCTDNKLIVNPDRTVSEPSAHARVLDHDSSIDLDYLKPEGMINMRTSAEGKECQENGKIDLEVGLVGKCSGGDDKVELPLKEGVGSSSSKLIHSSGDDNSMDSESQSCERQDVSRHDLHPNEIRTHCQLKRGEDSTTLRDERCNGKPDRYLRKYSKRPVSLKAISACETKFLYEGFCLESQASATGLPLNCSKASRTFSDASFQSRAIPLQTSACASGSSRDQSRIE